VDGRAPRGSGAVPRRVTLFAATAEAARGL